MEIERIIVFLGMVVSSLLFLALNNASSFWVMIVLVILWVFYLSWAWSEEAFVSGAIALLMSAALIYCHVFSPEIVPDLARFTLLGTLAVCFVASPVILVVESIKEKKSAGSSDGNDKIASSEGLR